MFEDQMSLPGNDVPPGWIGGFAQSNPAFAYPDPNLSSIPILGNLANINRLQRQQRVHWPEFSWEVTPGDESTRCFQRFAYNISSIGYDDYGRIWSIICPQQGIYFEHIGCLNIEVTVTGQRGWVDETTRTMAADMGVEAQIWFSPSAHQNWIVRHAWEFFESRSLPFPYNKANAIQITTHKVGEPDNPYFAILDGQNPRFQAPAFAQHKEKAWTVANLEVQIGNILPHSDERVNNFNQKVLDLFNIGSGNMLLPGNILTWNLWMLHPQLVNQKMWATHAERWRKSIDVDHGSPTGARSGPARYANGELFKPKANLLEEADDFVHLIEDLFL